MSVPARVLLVAAVALATTAVAAACAPDEPSARSEGTASTGLHSAEILHLQWRDVYFAGSRLAVTSKPDSPTFTGISEKDIGNTGQTVSSILGSSLDDVDDSSAEGIAITSLNETNGSWEPLPVGADLFSVKDGHVMGWALVEYDPDTPQLPVSTP